MPHTDRQTTKEKSNHLCLIFPLEPPQSCAIIYQLPLYSREPSFFNHLAKRRSNRFQLCLPLSQILNLLNCKFTNERFNPGRDDTRIFGLDLQVLASILMQNDSI